MIKKIEIKLPVLILAFTFLIGLTALIIYFLNDYQYLGIFDSIPRLNSTRKIVDSLTPGIGQLGAVWLPFPHTLAVPFIWNDTLWHTGIANALISVICFTFGGYFIFRLIFDLTGKRAAGLLGWTVYVSNINLLFFQASPMSEPLFIVSLIGAFYYLQRWILTRRLQPLLMSALFLIVLTLTRYEGYIILAIFCLSVFLLSNRGVANLDKRSTRSGVTILFSCLAFLGFLLWSIYLALIFKNPFSWFMQYKAISIFSPQGAGLVSNNTEGVVEVSSRGTPILQAAGDYFWVVLLCCGVFTSIFAIAGMVLFLINAIYKKKLNLTFLVLIFSLIALSLFLIIGVSMGFIPEIYLPNFSISSFLSKEFHSTGVINVRYGLLVLPFIAIFYAFFFSKNKTLVYLGFFLILFQLVINYKTELLLTYELPRQFYYQPNPSGVAFKKIYDDGKVLINETDFQYFIFDSGLHYKDIVHNGNREYWINSLKNPQNHVKWVIFDDTTKRDDVRNYVQKKKLNKYFNLVYKKNGVNIYRLKQEK